MERHGFTTFWLVLGVIFCFITGYIYLFSPRFVMQMLYAQGYRPSTGLLGLYGIIAMVGALCYILLLCWKRVGFWLFVITTIVQCPLAIKIGMNISQVIFGFASIAILWGILHIRKNGVSAWDYLTGNNTEDSSSIREKQEELKKCPFCAEEVKKEAIICRYCGKNIQEYETGLRMKEEEEARRKEQEMKDKYKSIEDLFKDENIMKEANELRRLYGKGVYISNLKNKAKELGLGDIDLTENDID